MRGKTTLALLIIFLGLLFSVYFFDIQKSRKDSQQEKIANRLFPISYNDVLSYSLKTANQELILEKDSCTWMISSPIRCSGDSSAIKSNLESILDIAIEREISDVDSALELFGLENPQSSIRIRNRRTSEARLLIGNINPIGEFVYVKFADSPAIYTVSNSLTNNVNRSLFDLRDKKIFHFNVLDIRRIEIFQKDSQNLSISKTGESWSLTEPIQAQVSTEAVNTFLNRLANGRVKRFIDELPADLSKYGLVEPALKIGLFANSEKSPVSLLVGKLSDDGNFACSQSQNTVFILDQWLVDNLKKTIAGFTDHKSK